MKWIRGEALIRQSNQRRFSNVQTTQVLIKYLN